MSGNELLGKFPVVEFRRYAIKPEAREDFARYFDSYFPEALQQSGAIALGQFLERDNRSHFTWIRGFHDIEARATANAALYDGPVWKEHRSTMNEHMLDHTNVLLLHPLNSERGIPVLPAVDPVRENEAARGVVVAQVFAVKPAGIDEFSHHAEVAFADYRSKCVREAGVLTTLDVPNNYPRLPFRTDGPYLVWLGVLENDEILNARLRPAAERAAESLLATGLVRSSPELIVMDPTRRSRLRWMP